MKDIRIQVENKLKSHMSQKQQLKALEYELDSINSTLHPEAIENKVFARTGGERVFSATPRDQTADIAVEHLDSLHFARYHELKNMVYSLNEGIRRLEYYLSLLPNEESEVIRWYYFERLSWNDIANKASLTARNLQYRRKRGLVRLVNLYNFAYFS